MSKSVTSLVLVLLLASLCAGQRHSLIQCNRRPGDRILVDSSVAKTSRFLQKVSDTVKYSGGRPSPVSRPSTAGMTAPGATRRSLTADWARRK
ncbi:hypothetical protein ANN_10526 [Periplaneta americana]|uniref:Secreted protein n=1 Tax=Periplaneta americana TaxID=6978 RepID=A0ABQ8TPB9_PERAM|nr:hypothetical protein ANN_10526 [Periplaneta americana]